MQDTRPADTELCPITYGTIRKITDALSKAAHEARQDKQRASRDPLWVFDDAAGALANIAGALVDDPHLHPDDRSAIEQDHYQLRNWEF
jgi:hypothetical protein